jgi:methyltransferase (TIGR00027 family)
VVLGAGLDTSAYRGPRGGLRMFEVDHPATQAEKRERLRAAGIAIPERLAFVPVDFERQTLSEELERSGFDLGAAAFFTWLGVVPYLTREAFLGTIDFLARRPAGSGVVFDFAVPRDGLDADQRSAFDAIARRVAAAGEPFRLFLDPEELAGELRRRGFARAEVLDDARINALYFAGRADGLRVGGGLGRLLGAET